jgi:hypothetical protein
MSNAMNNAPETLAPHYVEALKGGDVFECACGELYRSVGAARACRKCRQYLHPDTYGSRYVTDVRTGQIVWSTMVEDHYCFVVEHVCTCGEYHRSSNADCPLTIALKAGEEARKYAARHEDELLAAAKQPSAPLTCNPFAGRF